MRLEELCVVHLLKKGLNPESSGSAEILRNLPRNSFVMESCLRFVWVGDQERFSVWNGRLSDCHQVMLGAQAYQFLLRVASGLESQILGETDIFGQMKMAWSGFVKTQGASELSDVRVQLDPWIQRLFEDTKDIRSHFVQSIGGNSYGTLVRKLLKDKATVGTQKESVLLIGAGKLTHSILPYLGEYDVWLSNRSLEKINDLKKVRPDGHVVSSSEEEIECWSKANHVILCIPEDGEKDRLRQRMRQACENQGAVIHLGFARDQGYSKSWDDLKDFLALDDLFALEKRQGVVREAQVARARKACDERAKLRSLSLSLSVPHGWEDLALFA